MQLDRAILSLGIATFAILATWYLLRCCDKVAKNCLAHYYLRQLRTQGRTVLYDDVKSKSGAVLSVESSVSPYSKEYCIEYWWVPLEGDISSEIVLDKWFAKEALAFEVQKQIARLVRDGLVLLPVVHYREVSRFDSI